MARSATVGRFARTEVIRRPSEARIWAKSPKGVASLSRTAAGLLRAFLQAVGRAASFKKVTAQAR